jgi:hypothetical protein
LGNVLDASLTEIASIHERNEIATSARHLLYVHFGIRPGDRNDLIEPLARYGIALRRRNRPE